MKTIDHKLLGYYILEVQGADLDPMCKRAFLLGCVEPDWNVLTYTRGIFKYKFLHGHNAENARAHLTRLTQSLIDSGVQTPMQWFRFGAALHYLADSFTFAHNGAFTGSLLDHKAYETEIHFEFERYMQEQRHERFFADAACHERYLADERSYLTDCRYILGSALGLCDKLNVEWGMPLPKEAQGFYGQV